MYGKPFALHRERQRAYLNAAYHVDTSVQIGALSIDDIAVRQIYVICGPEISGAAVTRRRSGARVDQACFP
jgi:hypothetical protein